jgi:hypothetical protein
MSMEELLELQDYIKQQRYHEALDLIAEMEEMGREDKINKIYSFAIILLLHLIKQAAEKRITRSWELSILNASQQIIRINRRRKAGGTYLTTEELRETIAEAYPLALKRAALEAFEGRYDDEALDQLVDRSVIEQQAIELVTERS